MAETIYTNAGDTIVVTHREGSESVREEINLLVFDAGRSIAVEIELDSDALGELKDALENL